MDESLGQSAAALSMRVTTIVYYINFWSKGCAGIDRVVHDTGMEVSVINPDAASTLLANGRPDVVVVAFGGDTRRAMTFLVDYKASSWYRRVPLIALLESRSEDQWRLCMDWGCDEAIRRPFSAVSLRARLRQWALRKRQLDEEYSAARQASEYSRRAAAFAEIIVPLGVAMMAESDFDVLLEMILSAARKFCNADGGTLYLVRNDEMLDFKIIVNQSMNIVFRARPGEPLPFKPISLHLAGENGLHHIACHVALTGDTANVHNVYEETRFDCTGALDFDRKTGYQTRSLLTIALRDKSGGIIGVLQLINAMDTRTGEVVSFSALDQEFIERLSLLAGQALDSYRRTARLRRQANALIIRIDEQETAKQVDAVASSDYFKRLKAEAVMLRNLVRPVRAAVTS